MIARITGELVDINDTALVIDVNGVGYEVFVSPIIISKVGNLGSKVTLVVFTDVRETAIILYGFLSVIEKQTFLLLKKVKGIGSKIAMVILSNMTPEQLMIAIGQEDTSTLRKVPGIGKKSAERIIVELREKVIEFVNESSSYSMIDSDNQKLSIEISRVDIKSQSLVLDDVTQALQKLGFSREVATKAVKEASQNNTKYNDNVSELLKHSLACLG